MTHLGLVSVLTLRTEDSFIELIQRLLFSLISLSPTTQSLTLTFPDFLICRVSHYLSFRFLQQKRDQCRQYPYPSEDVHEALSRDSSDERSCHPSHPPPQIHETKHCSSKHGRKGFSRHEVNQIKRTSCSKRSHKQQNVVGDLSQGSQRRVQHTRHSRDQERHNHRLLPPQSTRHCPRHQVRTDFGGSIEEAIRVD